MNTQEIWNDGTLTTYPITTAQAPNDCISNQDKSLKQPKQIQINPTNLISNAPLTTTQDVSTTSCKMTTNPNYFGLVSNEESIDTVAKLQTPPENYIAYISLPSSMCPAMSLTARESPTFSSAQTSLKQSLIEPEPPIIVVEEEPSSPFQSLLSVMLLKMLRDKNHAPPAHRCCYNHEYEDFGCFSHKYPYSLLMSDFFKDY